MSRVSTSLFAVALALPVVGCAADTQNYPSLARRPGERVAAPATPTSAPASVRPAPTDPGLTVRLAGLVEQARGAHARFFARRAFAARLVAAGSGAAVASEPWAVASVALADLESVRSDAMIALADVDQLYAAAKIGDGDARGEIAAARDQVSAWIGEEDRILAGLRGKLGS